MAHKLSRLEHPWPAIVMHWVHLLSFFVLIATGLQIHAHTNWFGPLGQIRQVHFVVMYIFILTTITRIYWAFFGAGSARIGGLRRQRDWKFFGLSWNDWKALPQWVAYYLFIRKTRPPVEKYNPLQKLTYVLLFPLGILVMALTGFAMFEPSMAYFTWVTNLVGGLNSVRMIHYLVMWVLIVFFMIHFYLVFVEDPSEASLMFFHSVPQSQRQPGDYAPESTGSGATSESA